jgi:hypothetical protein
MSRIPKPTRRAFLRGAAGTALALPFLRSASAEGGVPTVPKRLIVWFHPCGWEAGSYPTSLDLAGTSLAALAPHAADLIVTRGLSMVSAGSEDAADHPSGFGHMLTGNVCDIASDDILRASSGSIDQVVAQRMGLTRRASSLHGISSMRTMSYDADGSPVMPENDPRVAFDRLFAGLSVPTGAEPTGPSTDALRRRSILATVRGSYERLRCELGGEDRVRLEAHLDQVRDIERRLDVMPPAPSAACAVPTLGPTSDDRQVGRLHAEILVRAMACDITRVGTIQWYSHTALYGGSYGWGGLGSHHAASHGDSHRPYDEAFAGELAYLLDLLRDTEAEDGQPLLHHTAVLCVSELGLNTNLHHLADLGIIIAGQAGGALSTGRYIDFLADRRGTFVRQADWKRQQEPESYFEDFDVPHNRLLMEIINAVSDPTLPPLGGFGMAGLGGGLPELR